VSPDTASVCDCGYSFQTGGTTCPNCQTAEALQNKGLADERGRTLVRLVGGRAAQKLVYGSPADEILCKQCGYRFKMPHPRRKVNFVALAILLVVLVVIAVIVEIMNG
jgi:predicted Zn-ribbon and HTH transcriptional regulator